MANGYIFLEVNPAGEARTLEYHFFDMEMREYVEFEDGNGLEHILEQLPEMVVEDTHVFASFNYSSHSTYDSYNGEYDLEENYEVESFTVLQTNYKEFTRKQLTLLVASITGPDMYEYNSYWGDPESYKKNVHDSVAEWEEFYDEDFKPTIPEKKPVNADFLHLLQGGLS